MVPHTLDVRPSTPKRNSFAVRYAHHYAETDSHSLRFQNPEQLCTAPLSLITGSLFVKMSDNPPLLAYVSCRRVMACSYLSAITDPRPWRTSKKETSAVGDVAAM